MNKGVLIVPMKRQVSGAQLKSLYTVAGIIRERLVQYFDEDPYYVDISNDIANRCLDVNTSNTRHQLYVLGYLSKAVAYGNRCFVDMNELEIIMKRNGVNDKDIKSILLSTMGLEPLMSRSGYNDTCKNNDEFIGKVKDISRYDYMTRLVRILTIEQEYTYNRAYTDDDTKNMYKYELLNISHGLGNEVDEIVKSLIAIL